MTTFYYSGRPYQVDDYGNETPVYRSSFRQDCERLGRIMKTLGGQFAHAARTGPTVLDMKTGETKFLMSEPQPLTKGFINVIHRVN